MIGWSRSRSLFVLSAVLATCFTREECYADLEICNGGSKALSAAIGYRDDSGWATEGWWNLPVGECQRLLVGAVPSRFVYLRVLAGSNKTLVAGSNKMCARDQTFAIRGVKECEGSQAAAVGFAEIDTGQADGWIMCVTERGLRDDSSNIDWYAGVNVAVQKGEYATAKNSLDVLTKKGSPWMRANATLHALLVEVTELERSGASLAASDDLGVRLDKARKKAAGYGCRGGGDSEQIANLAMSKLGALRREAARPASPVLAPSPSPADKSHSVPQVSPSPPPPLPTAEPEVQ
jgi:uncharacterized membrane protein